MPFNYFRQCVILGAFMVSILGCFYSQPTYDKMIPARLVNPNPECVREIRDSIKKMLKTDAIQFSDDVFTQDSMLILSSIRQGETPIHQDHAIDPIRIRFMLFRHEAECRLSRIDEQMNPIESVTLRCCLCAEAPH